MLFMSEWERVILESLYVFRFALKKLFWGQDGQSDLNWYMVSAHAFETKRQEVITYAATKHI